MKGKAAVADEVSSPPDLDQLSFFHHTEEQLAFVPSSPMGGNADELKISAPIPNFYRTTARFVEDAASQQQYENTSTTNSKVTAHPDAVVNDERSSLLPSSYYYQKNTSNTNNIPAAAVPTTTRVVGDMNPRRVVGDINSRRSSNLKNTLPQIVFRLRAMNLIVTTCTIICMIVTLWLKILNATKFVLSIYCIFGSILLCSYELHLSSMERIIQDKFGLLFSPHGRAAYIIFLGALCLTQGLFPFILGICLICNGLCLIHAICKYPDYVTVDQTSAARRDIRDIATQRVGEWAVPTWARPAATATEGFIGRTQEGETYGTINMPSGGDTLLFSGVKEVVDEEQEQLLERQNKFQGVQTHMSAILGNINLNACLPKSKKDCEVFEEENDDIEDEDHHYDRSSFIR